MNKYLLLHGHFYQPPRENPWRGSIGVQESAAPYHDWNERIYKECYEPNSCSRILDDEGKIESLYNNYAYMSFNIGPTLMAWIREKHPQTYSRIKEADQASAKRLNGHGNAMAQVYNHMIMPLASKKDQITQIKWGLADFKFHFHRDAEAMWLAETAIDQQTVCHLIEEGVRYVVLAPQQAAKLRPLGSSDWENTTEATLDTNKPYRIFPVDKEGKALVDGHLDVFFYDGPLSTAVSFERILKDATKFQHKIEETFEGLDHSNPVVSIATDGESYGHHEKFGDMCLAYLFERLLPDSGIEPINGGWYLDHFTPEYEVELTDTFGEGSAWSCAHGVGRWYRDCGCATGGEEHWNQEWRSFLRDGLDYLKTELDTFFVEQMNKIGVSRPWDVRNAYVDILLEPHLRRSWSSSWVSKEHAEAFYTLLEMQKYAMYMFTSCGWFFNDVEGIEPQQNLQYARKAIELAQNIDVSFSAEDKMLALFAKATSNESELPLNQIYQTNAVPKIRPEMLAVAPSFFDGKHNLSDFCVQSYPYSVESRLIQEQQGCQYWEILLEHQETLQTHMLWVLYFGSAQPLIATASPVVLPQVLPETPSSQWLFFQKEIKDAVPLCMEDVTSDDIHSMSSDHMRSAFESLCEQLLSFPTENSLLLQLMELDDSPVPKSVSSALKMSFNAKVYLAGNALLADPDEISLHTLKHAFFQAQTHNVQLELPTLKERFQYEVHRTVSKISSSQDIEKFKSVSLLIEAAELLKLDLDKVEIENLAYLFYQKNLEIELPEECQNFFRWLNFSMPEVPSNAH